MKSSVVAAHGSTAAGRALPLRKMWRQQNGTRKQGCTPNLGARKQREEKVWVKEWHFAPGLRCNRDLGQGWPRGKITFEIEGNFQQQSWNFILLSLPNKKKSPTEHASSQTRATAASRKLKVESVCLDNDDDDNVRMRHTENQIQTTGSLWV